MMSNSVRTPLFVRWSLSTGCDLRCMVNRWESPEQTERLLRPLREITIARQENRIFEGVAVSNAVDVGNVLTERPLGFIVDEVLEGFGGEKRVSELCASCRSNTFTTTSFAGCFGWIHQWGDNGNAIDWLKETIDRRGNRGEVELNFPPTNPIFYGLWMPKSYSAKQLDIMLSIFAATAANEDDSPTNQFGRALNCAIETGVPLQTQLFPSGELQGRTWRVAAHCSTCAAERVDKARLCPTCLTSSKAIAAKQRKAKGVRPYFALADFLGPENLADFLRRYFVSLGENEGSVAEFFERNSRFV